MKSTVQLLVARRGLDPVAWTALHALRELELPATPRALGRAELWEFALPDERAIDDLIRWAGSANWFANPSRDLVCWRRHAGDPTSLARAAVRADGGVGGSADGAYLAVTWLHALAAPAHEKAVCRHLGEGVEVRRGHVWWLGVDGEAAPACLRVATGAGAGGLLVNPHSQRCHIFSEDLPLPTLFTDIWEAQPAGGVV